ncbi:MAG: glutathione S-transferase family protein [Pseudomonadota bacterium]
MLKFYFHHTPNPMKVALALEEMELAYELVPVDTFKGEQHLPGFRAINPNGKLPALVDGNTTVFDSNAILLYLAEKTGRFLGRPEDRGQLLSWMMFIASGLGPFSGQSVHFSRIHTDSAYATNRYRREAERHYAVLEERLADRPYVLGDDYSVVDMAAWGWIDRAAFALGNDDPLAPTPNLARWFAAVDGRPAVARARAIGNDVVWKTEADDVAKRALFPSNYPPAA